jgi:hypothetical protein
MSNRNLSEGKQRKADKLTAICKPFSYPGTFTGDGFLFSFFLSVFRFPSN